MSQPHVVDLVQAHSGFYQFFSSWIYLVGDTSPETTRCVVVDPGPTSSINLLITTLRSRGIESIDHLLLTHIHLDHAGGTGDLVAAFPVGQIACHSKAIPHLVDPTKLWEGSCATLGEFALLQGEPSPVPERLLLAADSVDFAPLTIGVFPSPGHAPHHISFLIESHLFVGEALGVIIPEVPGYIRPATPPRFSYDAYVASIERLVTVPAERLCFAHYGMTARTDAVFAESRAQIDRWISMIGPVAQHAGPEPSQMEIDTLFQRLLASDPAFSLYKHLAVPLQSRERHFVKNSITGIWRFCRNET